MSEELDIEVDDVEAKIETKPKKNMSVVKYDPETDTNFHDIDMNEFRKWQVNHECEYQEDLKILKRLEAMCPREEVVYSGRREKNCEQRKSNPFYDVLYGFHKAANANYLDMYRAKRTKRRIRYEELKEKAKEYLKNPTVFEEKRKDDLWAILNDIGI